MAVSGSLGPFLFYGVCVAVAGRSAIGKEARRGKAATVGNGYVTLRHIIGHYMEPLKQHKYAMWAAYVWWLSIAISSTFGYLNQSGVFDKHGEKPATPVVLFFFHLMMAGFGYLVWKGYRWAKALMLAALVYGLATSFYHFSKGENLILLNSQAGFHSLVQWLLSIAITILLVLGFMPTKSETETQTGTAN